MSVDFGNSLTRDQVDGPGDDPAQARAQLDAIIARLNDKLVNVTILTASDKTGNDSGIVSGTAGTDGNLVQWNADGDVVDGPDVLSAISSGSDTDVVSKEAVQGAGVAALVPLAQATASDDASVDFTSVIDGTYDVYLIIVSGMVPATDDTQPRLRFSSDGGTNFDDGASDYRGAWWRVSSSGGANIGAVADGSQIAFSQNLPDGSANGADFRIWLYHPNSATLRTSAEWDGGHRDTGGNKLKTVGTGEETSASVVDAIRFFMGSGNIASGTFRLYGVKNS